MTNTKMIKITGIMITLVMLVTTLGAFVLMASAADGTPVAKVGEVEYTDFATAVANWTDNTTLTLLADVTDLAEQIELSGNGLVLDLNGKKLEATVDHAIKISAGELTIRDSVGTGSFTTTQSGGLWVFGGNVNFESGTLESVTISKGTFNMTGGTIQTEAFTGIYVNGDEGAANISGGEINVTDDNLMGVYNGFGTLNLSGNVVITSTYGYAFQNSDASVLTTISGDVALNGSTGEFYLAKAIVMNTQPTGDTTWRVSINTGNNSGIENGIFAIPGDGVTLDPAKFTSPMDGYEVKLNNKNELVLCNHSAATVAVSNGNGTHNTTCDCNGIIFESNIACSGGVATANHLAVCAYCGGTYGELDANVNYDIIATSMTAAELKNAMAAWLADGNTDISVLLAAYAGEEMFAAVKTALAESTAADGSINLTLAGVKAIPDEAFSDYPISIGGSKLKTLTLTNAETTGEFEAFAYCTYLEAVSLPNATRIGEWTFNGCSNLTSVYCPKVTVIGEYAFGNCAKLTAFDFTNTTTIEDGAFRGCGFNTIVLPEAISIGGSAFVDNPNLVSFSAPKATSFGWYPWGAESIETSKLETLELTAAGEFTIENNFSAYTPFEQINLVLNIDKKDQVTQKDDGTATWTYPYTNSSTGTETKTFKSITLTCVDGTTNHTYQYTDMSNGTHKAECTVEGCGFYKYEAHTSDEDAYTNNGDGTHSFTCTACQTAATEGHTGGTATCKELAKCERCGESYGEVDTTNHDSSVAYGENGFCPNGCYQPATLNSEGYYEIDNAGKLFWFAAEVNGGNTEINGKLMTDIDLENRPWTPIGNSSNRYNGTFDGNGKTISGLYFNDSTGNNVGLFGYIYDNGQVKAVTLTNSTITGYDCVGGIAGKNYGIITGCVNNALVSGYEDVGGIAGYNSGTVEMCGNTNKINSRGNSGGIVGRNSDMIRNCYNIGDVHTNLYSAGGIVGYNNSGTAEYCWSTGAVTTDDENNGGIAGKNDGALLSCYSAEEPIGSNGSNGTYSDVGTRTAAQFASGEVAYLLGSAWGQTIGSDNYPEFINNNQVYVHYDCDGTPHYTNDEALKDYVEPHVFTEGSGGFCTECNQGYQPATLNSEGYYEIDNAGKLFWFAAEVNGGNTEINGKLMTDIDLENRPWTPIGNSSNRYNGIFDGNGKTIKGLYFYDENAEGVGLFGYIGTNGQVKAVTLTNSTITGSGDVGGIAGHNRGIITGCVNNAVVSSSESSNVGGIAGYNYGTVEMCGNTGKITSGLNTAGGIAGRNSGTIRNCYNTGDVYAENIDAGGIAGLNLGLSTVEYCWSTGKGTAGYDYQGGIAGKNGGTVQYCYATQYPIGNNSDGTSNNVGTRTAAQFASGEVAYLLGPAWGQTLGTNATPVFATDANKVYQSFACDGTTPLYTNDASLEGKAAPHTFGANSNGFCTECNVEGVYQPAVYNEEKGYYEISNAGQLFWFAGLVNGTLDGVAQNASANAILTADIDLNIGATINKDGTYETLDVFREWTPIGSSTTPYAGAFRGVQQSISHVYINSTDDYQGLFGYVTGTVNGCTVRDSYVKGKDYVGGVIGYLESSGDLLFCKNESPVTGEKYVGGVVGYADSVNLVNECANEGKVVGTEYVGGVIGYASYEVETIVKCENSGFISGEECVGGLLGWGDGTIENCTNDGDVSGTSGVGGMAGWVVNGTKILNCANRGTVAGTSSVGGLVGRNGNVESSYNLGIVKGVASAEAQIQGTNDSEDVGGIVGYHLGTVNKCYNDGLVTGYKNVGGIVGNNSGTVNQCHNIKTVEGMDSVGGIVGYNDGTVQYCFNQGNVPSVYVNQEGVETRIPFSGAVVGQKDWYGSTELNCYYLISDTVNVSVGGINGRDSAGRAEAKTAEQFASGELTWKLNLGISDGTQAWYQTLSDSGNVQLPTLVPEGSGATILNAVYRSAPCGISYSNESGVVIEHTYVNGICTACDSFMQPTQNAEGYYEIDNAGKLYWFAEYVNSKVQIAGADTPDDTTDDVYSNSANAVLTANITVNENVLSDTYELNEGTFREWTPIGKQSSIRFEGIFDGQGYTVSGLYAYFENIATSVTGATLPQGMFGMLDDYAVVKNLTLADTYFYAEYGEMGAIVGWNTGTVENCFAEALLVSGSNMLGGIVGENYGSVKGCTFAGVLKSVSYIGSALGGIVGHNAYGGKVQNCINLGDILGRNQVGGIVGSLGPNSGVVENCYNTGSLSGEKMKNYDLIIGQVIGDPETYASQVINCYYLADSESDTIYGTTAKTAAQFASGEVAYLLGDAFGQTIGTDDFPVFANDANKVYMLANCDGTPYIYTNDANITITEHQAGVSAAECFDENGVCLTCGTQAAARLTTADATPVVTYYMMLEDAIDAAQSAEGSTVTLLDDCASSVSNWFTITSGSFKINFNGKKLMPKGATNCSLRIEGGSNITLFDDNEAQGGVSKMVVVREATLTIDGGIFESIVQVDHANGTLIIHNGTVSKIEHVQGALTIKGGEFSFLLVYKSSGKTPADVLPKDYYFYDKDGKIINAGAIVPDSNKYQVEDFTVKKGADLSKDAVITVSESEYNGTAQTPTVIVTVGGVTLEYGVDYKSIGHGVPISAGSYTISIMGQGNYTGSVNVAYTIEKATPKADNFSGAMPDGAIYDGTAKTAFIEAKSGIVGMGEITVKYYKDGSEVESATNAGTYTVKISVAEGTNFKAVTDLEIGSFTIAKATPVVTPPTAIEDLIYNGELQAIATPGSTTGGTMQYAVYRGEYDGVGIPENVWEEIIRTGPDSEIETKAGTYSVLYRVASDDNYESVAMQYITVTVGEATPTLNVTAPVSSILPGNTILLSYTLTGVKDEVLTNLVTVESAKVGNLTCDFDGFKVTVPSTAVIGGEDKLVVTVISHAGGNYGASEVFTLTLDIGVADFTGEITDLQADIDELNDLIANKADVADVTAKLAEITAKITALEQNGATDAELASAIDAAKSDITQAYEQMIEDAVADLETKIAAQIDPDELAAAVADLEAMIDAAKAYADTQDATLKSELEAAIDAAKSEAISSAETLVNNAKTELQNAIDNKADTAALNEKVEALNTAIETAETVAKAYADEKDAALKQEFESKIAEANDLIASLDQRVTEAEKAIDEIETAIENLKATDAADAKALEDAIEMLERAIADAKQAASDADTALQAELNGKIESADAALEAKVAEVQANLNKAVEDLKAADTSNSDALANAIETLNKAIDAAEAAAVTGDTALDGKITEAQTALDAKIAEVQSKLDQAKADLEQAIKTGDTVLDGKISALTDALGAAEAALKAADATNKTELEGKITSAQSTLQAAIDNVQTNLDNTKAELDKAIADLNAAMKQGDDSLSTEIANLNAALKNAQAALETADADNKAELISKIETADATLDAAIKAVESKLDAAKTELNEAIASGDKALSDEIDALNAALADAQEVLAKADADNKAELAAKIETADATLDAAIKAVEGKLDAAKTELNEAIASGDKALSDEINALNAALADAQSVLGKADADNKAELISKIETADATLDAAIKAVEGKLDAAKTELNEAIASGDKALSDEIDALNAALADAQSVLGKADADNKAELISKIETADATLDAAIKAVQTNLDAAQVELNQAIENGDTALNDKIAALNEALTQAQAALKATAEADKSELAGKIDQGYAAMETAVKAVQTNLDAAKAELQAAVDGLKAEQQRLSEELAQANAKTEQTEKKTQTTQIVSVATVGAVNAGLLAGAFFFLRRKKLF